MKTKTFFLGLLALWCGLSSLSAQVIVGQEKLPEAFSVLELISNNTRGLRLPQLSDADKIAAFGADNSILTAAGIKAQGLQIFNTTTLCVETWNGAKWILACACGSAPCPDPIIVIPSGKGGATWTTTKWVGAFWRDNQTGERIIASKNTAGVAWTASVDEPAGSGSWLTLDANGGYDPDI